MMRIKRKKNRIGFLCVVVVSSFLFGACSLPEDGGEISGDEPGGISDFLEDPVDLTLDDLKGRLPEDYVSVKLSDGNGAVYSSSITFSRCGENLAVEILQLGTGDGRRFTNFYLIDGTAYLYRKDAVSPDTEAVIYRCPDKADAGAVERMIEEKRLNLIVPVREDYEKIYMFRSNEEEDTISATVTAPDDCIDTFVIDKKTDTIKSVKIMEDHSVIKHIYINSINEISVGELPEDVQEMELGVMMDCVSEEILRYMASLNIQKIHDWQPWDFKPVPGV